MRRQRAIGCGLGGRPPPLSNTWMPEPLHEYLRSPPHPSPSQCLGARNDKQKSLCASSGRCSGGQRSALRKEHEHGVRQRREAGGLGVCRRTRCHARSCVAQSSSIEDRCWHDSGDDKGREERQTNREIGDGEEASRRNRLVRGNVAPYTADVRWLTGQGGEGVSLTTLHGAHIIVRTSTSTQIFSFVVERASIRG